MPAKLPPLEERLAVQIAPRDAEGHEIFTGLWIASTARRHPAIVYEGKKQPVRLILWRRAGNEIPPGKVIINTCGVEDCVALDHMKLAQRGSVEVLGAKVVAQRGRKASRTRRGKGPQTISELVQLYSKTDGDCLLWTGKLHNNNLPMYHFKGRMIMVRREVFKERYGFYPEVCVVTCDNHTCLTHIENITRAENTRRNTNNDAVHKKIAEVHNRGKTDHLLHAIYQHIERTDYCWNWTGYMHSGGTRPILSWRGGHYYPRTILWMGRYGDKGQRIKLGSKCGNIRCVNPSHWRWLTNKKRSVPEYRADQRAAKASKKAAEKAVRLQEFLAVRDKVVGMLERKNRRGLYSSEDIVQVALLKIMNRKKRAQVQDATAYLVSTAFRVMYEAVKNRRVLASLDVESDQAYSLMEIIPGGDDPLEVLIAEEILTTRQQIVDQLPARNAEVYVKHRIEGYTYDELAEQYKVSPSMIKKLLSKGAKLEAEYVRGERTEIKGRIQYIVSRITKEQRTDSASADPGARTPGLHNSTECCPSGGTEPPVVGNGAYATLSDGTRIYPEQCKR